MDRQDLPIEAAKINGQYIEDILPGYTTVITSGREGLPAELNTYSVGSADGERVKSSTFPARVIEIEFVLQGDSMDDLRQKLIKLNNILSVEESDVVFNDESDKFYTGYPLMQDSFSDYKNAARGKVTADNTKAKTGAAGSPSAKDTAGTGNSDFAIATPDESLYPHYDSKQEHQDRFDEYNDRRDQAQERVDLGDRLDAVERRIRIKDSCQGVDESEAVRKQVDDRCQCRNKQYDQSCFQRRKTQEFIILFQQDVAGQDRDGDSSEKLSYQKAQAGKKTAVNPQF